MRVDPDAPTPPDAWIRVGDGPRHRGPSRAGWLAALWAPLLALGLAGLALAAVALARHPVQPVTRMVMVTRTARVTVTSIRVRRVPRDIYVYVPQTVFVTGPVVTVTVPRHGHP